MSVMGVNGTVLYDGGSQEKVQMLQERDFLAILLALSVNEIAAT